jgi:potassium efflux system protein
MKRLKNRHLKVYSLRAVLIMVLATSLYIVPSAPLRAAQPTTPAPSKAPETPKASAPSGPAAIALPDVAARAMEVANLLRSFTVKLAPSKDIETIREQFLTLSRKIEAQIAVTRRIIHEEASLETLQSQQQIWQGLERQTAVWLSTLTERATRLQDAQNQLKELQETWMLTSKAARSSEAPEPILQQIDATIYTIEAARKLLQLQATSVLDLQSRLAVEAARSGTALVQIAEAQHVAVGGIFERIRPPIWSADLWARVDTVVPPIAAEATGACREAVTQYLHKPHRGLPLHAGLFAGLALLLLAAQRQVARWKEAGDVLSSSTLVFDRPWAAALTGFLIMASGPYSPAPAGVKQLFEVLALVPMIRLIRPMIYPPLVPALFVLVVLFAADNVRQAMAGAPPLGQGILVLEGVVGIAVLGWVLRAGHLRSLSAQDAGSARWCALEAAAILGILVMSAGLATAALGYLRLARLLSPGFIALSALGLTLYALAQVIQGAVVFALRVWPLARLRMVLHHRDRLERRIYRLLLWVAVIVCIMRYLDYIGLMDPAVSFGKEILEVKLGGAVFSTSVGDIIAFFLTVWAAYLLSSMLRFVLQEDVYPRIGLQTGLSYATSSLLNYIILAVGVVVAMGVLGVNLTQVTVLAGAFGVGIGFGLQSVVNNFVSGLILLFEQPIHVDDTIEVGDLLGKIRRIGIRASTVRTWQGADIIVPNAQLVTENVTNWTLSDQLRRIDLPVGVSYSAAPQEVIKIMEATALANPRVLRYPAPQALMMGYGDSSINYEIRAWTSEFDNWPAVRSELAVALYDAVHAAGMIFPFPQREVRLLQEPVKASEGADPRGAESPQ